MAHAAFLLLLVNCLVAVPVAIYCLEVLAALNWPPRKHTPSPPVLPRPRVAVLIPAHNEGSNLVPTVQDVLAQVRSGDRVCVVADNCSDDTAAVARSAGAEAVERHDLLARGKSYALEFGLRHLADDPPEVVIIVDADCRLGENAIDRLVGACLATGRPVQASYVILAPDQAGAGMRIAEFAQIVKNRLRPRGLQLLGFPCHLSGSGMALPWKAARAVDFANGEAVEDLKLGLDLTAAGYPPVFCPSAEVFSFFPVSVAGAATQRQRWQHGHLRMILLSARRLLTGAMQGNAGLVALTLDLMVPPLTLLVLVLGALLLAGSAAAVAGATPLVFALPAISSIFFAGATLAAWLAFDRRLSASGIMKPLFGFIVERSALYPSFLTKGRSVAWVRTERANGTEQAPPSR